MISAFCLSNDLLQEMIARYVARVDSVLHLLAFGLVEVLQLQGLLIIL